VAAPLFHIAGLNCFTLDALSRGCTVLLRRSFDAPRTLYDLTHGVTTVFGVPAMYAALTRLPEFAHADLSGVRKAVVGGGPAQADLVGRLARSGMTVHPSWGMTELAGGGTVLSGDEAPAKPCSVGRPLPYLEVTLRADDSAVITEPGAPGEVWVRGPQVTRGYWQDPEATEAALTAEGWLRTKDLASWDVDGCLTLAGRTCEVINTGGEKVVPGEVEVALRTLPVDELVVVGAPDPLWGETVVVVVACAPDRVPSLEDVRASAGGTLAHYKMPTRVVAVAELPRTASGKVDRCAVRALAARAEI
jgi:fatty-acyl-CoA synthase